MHFTSKTKPLRSDDLADFVEAYSPEERSRRVESERFRCFTYDELVARDKANRDITWLRDKSLSPRPQRSSRKQASTGSITPRRLSLHTWVTAPLTAGPSDRGSQRSVTGS